MPDIVQWILWIEKDSRQEKRKVNGGWGAVEEVGSGGQDSGNSVQRVA